MDEDKVRNWILERTTEKFYSEGFSGLTMDDVAGTAGISKKTLYKLIPSKNDLILSVIGRQIDIIESRQKEIMADSSLDFPGKLDRMVRAVSAFLTRLQPKAIMDMTRMSPDLWNLIRARRARLLDGMIQILEEGRSEGRIRSDITPSFLARYFSRMVDALVTPESAVEEHLTPAELMDITLSIIYNGIFTPEGGREFRRRHGERQ